MNKLNEFLTKASKVLLVICFVLLVLILYTVLLNREQMRTFDMKVVTVNKQYSVLLEKVASLEAKQVVVTPTVKPVKNLKK